MLLKITNNIGVWAMLILLKEEWIVGKLQLLYAIDILWLEHNNIKIYNNMYFSTLNHEKKLLSKKLKKVVHHNI